MQNFQHRIASFGEAYVHHLEHPDGHRLSVVPRHGACIVGLELNGMAVLDTYDTEAALLQNSWMKSNLLYPFPNRLAAGTYLWEGEGYNFPINDVVSGHAIHGFRELSNFTVESVRSAAAAALLVQHDYGGEEAAYPFPFVLDVIYRLKASGACNLTLRLTKTGDSDMPVGLGWHPYIRLAPSVDELILQLPPCELIGVDSRMLPVGKKYTYDHYASGRSLQASVLDNCFLLQETTHGRSDFHIRSAEHELVFWRETGPGKFNYFQLFTPDHRSSLGLIPMTCNINAFNNGEGLMVLEAGQHWQVSCGLELKH